MPDIPTIAEAGVPGFETSLWFALVAPAKLPQPIAARLNRELKPSSSTRRQKGFDVQATQSEPSR